MYTCCCCVVCRYLRWRRRRRRRRDRDTKRSDLDKTKTRYRGARCYDTVFVLPKHIRHLSRHTHKYIVGKSKYSNSRVFIIFSGNVRLNLDSSMTFQSDTKSWQSPVLQVYNPLSPSETFSCLLTTWGGNAAYTNPFLCGISARPGKKQKVRRTFLEKGNQLHSHKKVGAFLK